MCHKCRMEKNAHWLYLEIWHVDLTLLEQFMGTRSMNVKMQQFIDSIYRDIEQREYERAEDKINELADITSENHGDVIMARMELKRRMHDRRKRSCGNQISWSKEGWI